MKCVICEVRPAREDGYCANCTSKIKADRKRKEAQKPVRFLTYRGFVVGLFQNGKGTLTSKLLKRNPENLTKSKTLDLNTYLEGFSRKRIKEFKSCVLRLANA